MSFATKTNTVEVDANRFDNLQNALTDLDVSQWDSGIYSKIWAVVSAAKHLIANEVESQ